MNGKKTDTQFMDNCCHVYGMVVRIFVDSCFDDGYRRVCVKRKSPR